MILLLTGAAGMLGRTLVRRFSGTHTVIACARGDLDVADLASCHAVLLAHRPDVVVHCAAHTAVDRCEHEADAAFRLNAIGSANIAQACHASGARLIAISTDYVFAGDLPRPYHEWDATGPRTIYGQSKLAGEQAVRALCPHHVIARVAWLYGPGGPSFVHTMLKLGAQDGAPLRVVDDQLGNPTSTDAVADGLVALLPRDAPCGTFHLTCRGETSWHGFTAAIFARAGLRRGLLPCTTQEFPRPAPRPANSRLDDRMRRLHGLPPLPDWQDALARFLADFPYG